MYNEDQMKSVRTVGPCSIAYRPTATVRTTFSIFGGSFTVLTVRRLGAEPKRFWSWCRGCLPLLLCLRPPLEALLRLCQ